MEGLHSDYDLLSGTLKRLSEKSLWRVVPARAIGVIGYRTVVPYASTAVGVLAAQLDKAVV